MALVKGQPILASIWNSFVRAKDRKTIFSKSVADKPFEGDDISGTGTFWARGAGWNWPQFLAEHKTGVTYVENEEVALYATPVATEYIIAVRCNNVSGTSVAPDPAHADWDLYRYEFGYQSVVIGDEVIYGGGLFTALTNAGVTPPVIPKYKDVANVDPNYARTSSNNSYVSFDTGGFSLRVYIELERPGVGANIRVYDRVTGSDESSSFWLSPGKYYYYWQFVDQLGLGTGKIEIETQVYDDNVKQWSELRVFSNDLSDFLSKGGTELLSGVMNDTPVCTDFDIGKKGGTASLYTGDW